MTRSDLEELERQTVLIRRIIQNGGDLAPSMIAKEFDKYLERSGVGSSSPSGFHDYFPHWCFMVSLPITHINPTLDAWCSLHPKEDSA